jgi:phosphohistidine phosphatase
MLITFLRHATAELHSPDRADAERALIEKGKQQVKRVAAFCAATQLTPRYLLHSPLLRAVQTAQWLQQRLPGCAVPQSAAWLSIDSDPHGVIGELAKLDAMGRDDVWLVGHEPDFSQIIALLLQLQGGQTVVKKASLIRVEVDFSRQPPCARLLWSVPCALMAVKAT